MTSGHCHTTTPNQDEWGARDATRLEPQVTINERTFFFTMLIFIGSKFIIFIKYVKQNDATTNTNDVHYHYHVTTKCQKWFLFDLQREEDETQAKFLAFSQRVQCWKTKK